MEYTIEIREAAALKDVWRWAGEEAGNYAGKIILDILLEICMQLREQPEQRERERTESVHCASQRHVEASRTAPHMTI